MEIRSLPVSRASGRKKLAGFSSTRSYDPSPHSKHVVALMSAETPQEPHDRVIFLPNFDELRRRVPLNAN
jgi:hypothetical protein